MPTCFSAQMRLARDGEEVVIYIVFPRGVSLSPFRQDLPERREAPSVVVSACHIGDSCGWACIREAQNRGSSSRSLDGPRAPKQSLSIENLYL